MSIKHRSYQVTAIASLIALITFLTLVLNASEKEDSTVLYMSLFLFSCIVFYYSSKKYIAYEVKKRKAKRGYRKYRRMQQLD